MLRLAVRVSRAEAELALAELIELMPDGVEEVDIDTDTVEYAVYGAVGELPLLPALRAAVGGALVDIITTEVADDWADRWREFHKPLVLGTRLSVRPPWEPLQGTELELVIDPGRAFGTGAHATTRLCLELLLDLDVDLKRRPSGRNLQISQPAVIDLGCGSGVLAIAAAQLGWSPVWALDYDQLCIDATRENAEVNGVELAVIDRFDLREDELPPAGASLVLANLLGPLLLTLAQRISARSPKYLPRWIIASGLLSTEADAISQAFAYGYDEQRRIERGEWAALLLTRREPR
jgi:ribosomal protein L11 methyltransferase